MRVQIAAVLLLAATTVICCEPETLMSRRPAVSPEGPESSQTSLSQLRIELSELRDAALSDGYVYRQVAHLTGIFRASVGNQPEDCAYRVRRKHAYTR
jgi:hypothetical protein